MFQLPIIEKEENYAIIVEQVSKRFKIPHEKRNTVVENITNIIKSSNYSYDEFWSLKNISFKVKKGETLGIIGENGSGKSTLLKLVAGVLQPDRGTVRVNGRIAPFLELGVGFQPELTAEENVRLYGAVMGMGKKEIENKFEEIFEFAELEKFKEMKLKNFSSGMYMRLAFSTATATNPDLLLIDEVLGVGDEAFQRKCSKRISEFKDSNKTILFVSHDANSVRKLCNKVILLKQGEIIENNDANTVIDRYHAMLSDRERLNEQQKMSNKEKIIEEKSQSPNYRRHGTRKADIFDMQLIVNDKKDNNFIKTINFGDITNIELRILFKEESINPIAGYIIRDTDGREVYNTNTLWNDIMLGKFKKDDSLSVVFSQRMFLNNGLYFITVALAYSDATQFYDWHDNVIQINVTNNKKSCGVVDLQSKIRYNRI